MISVRNDVDVDSGIGTRCRGRMRGGYSGRRRGGCRGRRTFPESLLIG